MTTEYEIILPKEEPFRLVPISNDRKNLICPYCKDDAVLKDFKVGDGSYKYLQCPLCNIVIEPSQARHKSIIGPLGSVGQTHGIGTYMAVPTNRRTKRNTSAFIPTESPVLDFPNGMPDKDLQALVTGRPAIILSCVDSIIDTVGEDDYD